MAKPSTSSEWQFIVQEKEERVKTLTRELTSANNELTSSRKEIERLKSMKLELEDAVTDYRADVSKWRTLYEQVSQQKQVNSSDHQRQRQMDDSKIQLTSANDEIRRLNEQIKLLQIRSRQFEDRPDNPHSSAQIETNRLRYTIQQKDDDIRRVLQDLQEQRDNNRRLNVQLQAKEEEIDRLRKQLLSTPVFSPAPPVTSPHQNMENQRLKDEIRRCSGENHKLKGEIQALSDRNIHLHQQNMMYEEDYKREKEERVLCERRLQAAKDETLNLQAVLDVVNQGGGGGRGGIQPS